MRSVCRCNTRQTASVTICRSSSWCGDHPTRRRVAQRSMHSSRFSWSARLQSSSAFSCCCAGALSLPSWLSCNGVFAGFVCQGDLDHRQLRRSGLLMVPAKLNGPAREAIIVTRRDGAEMFPAWALAISKPAWANTGNDDDSRSGCCASNAASFRFGRGCPVQRPRISGVARAGAPRHRPRHGGLRSMFDAASVFGLLSAGIFLAHAIQAYRAQ